MRRSLISAVFFALLATACSSNPTIGEAKRQYLVPTLCEKQRECLGQEVFDTAHSGGMNGCLETGNGAIPASQNDEISACDEETWQACSRDLKAAACPPEGTNGGLPELPPSCKSC